MSSGTGIKQHFGQFSVAALAGAAGTVLATAFLAWWNWIAVKAFLTGVGAWLMGTTEVYRVVVLAVFLVLAAVLARAALWWHRGRAAGAPVVELVDATAPRVPADFNPTGIQLAALGALLQRYDQATTLAQLHGHLDFFLQTLGGKPFLAREMEQLARAEVVRIDETGVTDRSYSLTTQGRNWYLDQLENAAKHPEQGPQGNPRVEPEKPARFAPETFTLTGPRCRALLALLDRVDRLTSLEDLHKASVQNRTHVDWNTTKAHAQQDMEEAERAGIVRSEAVDDHTRCYTLSVPSGRDWVLSKEAELKAQAIDGMTARGPQTRYF